MLAKFVRKLFWVKSILGFVLLLMPLLLAGQDKQPRVLVLHAYHYYFPAFSRSQIALKHYFPKGNFKLDVEFMHSKSFPQGTYYKDYYKVLKKRLDAMSGYDLVFAAHDNALDFALKYHKEFFPGVPIIFWGVNDTDKALSMDSLPGVTGVVEAPSILKTLRMAQRLDPGLEEVIAITDSANTTQADARSLLQLRDSVPFQIQTLNFSGLSRQGFTDSLAGFRGHKAFLLLGAYIDSAQAHYSFYQSLRFILSHSHLPVYHLWHHGFTHGIVGGCFVDAYQQAATAAEMGLAILDGKSVADFPVIRKSPNRYHIDIEAATRYNLHTENIPEAWELYNTPPSKVRLDRTVYQGLLLEAIGVTLLVFVLVFIIRRLKRNGRMLAEARQYYESLFSGNGVPMMIIDPTGQTVVEANNAACIFYGYSPGELKNKQVQALFDMPPHALQQFVWAVRRKVSHRTELEHQKKDGTVVFVEMFAGRIKLSGQDYIYTLAHDITSRKEFQRQLVAAKERAEESDRLKSAFLANMSHEIRTPLNAIVGFTQLMAGHNISREKSKRYGSRIKAASDQLLKLISDIIDIATIESGEIELQVHPFRVDELLQKVAKEMAPILEKYGGLSLHIAYTGGAKSWLGDAQRLQQVLKEFIENAAKYSAEGAITLGAHIHNNKNLIFYVSDKGAGVSPEMQQQIFQRFVQDKPPDSTHIRGTGLGLPICKHLIQLHKGRIWLKSRPGKGSTFYFAIPNVDKPQPNK